MMCDICGKENSHVRHITRSYGKGENLLIIENIPAIRCLSCEETYLTADILHEIERIKLHPFFRISNFFPKNKNFIDNR